MSQITLSEYKRFPGLKLSPSDQEKLTAIKRVGGLSARRWRRIRALELLHDDWNLTQTAKAIGCYPREIRRIGWRYLKKGIEHALREEQRPSPAKKLDTRGESQVVAIVCSQPPKGRARWTIRLVVEEVQRRGIIDSIGDETIRRILVKHDLKPWREKNVVCSDFEQ